MRVISGTARGHKLTAPKSELVRPALDKVKGAIFNILFDVAGSRVLDLFAGSGSVGIEALSRGADFALFVDNLPEAVLSIRKNLEKCKFTDKARILKAPVSGALRKLDLKGEIFDLVFVDPPYLKGLVQPTIEALSETGLLAPNAIVVVEHHPKEPVSGTEIVRLTDSRKYGQTCVSFLRRS